MSAKAIQEFDGKRLLATHLTLPNVQASNRIAQVQLTLDYAPTSVPTADAFTNSQPTTLPPDALANQLTVALTRLPIDHPWLLIDKLVVKPDQLIKRRGKAGLLLLNATWAEVAKWITEKAGKEITVI